MEEDLKEEKIIKPFKEISHFGRLFLFSIVAALILGTLTGYLLANKGGPSSKVALLNNLETPKHAQQDTRTFRDFAEGKVKIKPQPKDPNEYTEGTHLLERSGAYPVTLTSSVVDLSKYEGKNVKVLGETQKAIKEGWLMDVGKIEEVK